MEQEFPHKYSLLFINQVKYHVIEEDQSKEVQQYARNHDGAYQIQQMTGNKAQAKPPPKKKQKNGYNKKTRKAPPKKNSFLQLSESLEYEEENDRDIDKNTGPFNSIQKKQCQMAANRVNGARGEDSHSEDDESQQRENIQQIRKKMRAKGAC